MIIELTKSFIDTRLVVPEGEKKIEFCDTNVRGLLIQVNASGKMLPTYFLRFKRDGKTVGAVGVSGATSQEDGLIAAAGIAALEAALAPKK